MVVLCYHDILTMTDETKDRIALLPKELQVLVKNTNFAVLGTLHHDGESYPYCSMVQYVVMQNHTLVFQTASIAEHSKNLAANNHISLYISDASAIDLSATPRITIVGTTQRLEGSEYQAAQNEFQRSAYPLPPEILDSFFCWKVCIKKIRWISGFGKMGHL